MSTTYLKQLLDHEHWASVGIAETLQTLDTIPEKAKSIFDHLIAAHEAWYARTQSTAPSIELWWQNIPVADYKILLDNFHNLWLKLLDEPGSLERKYTYKNSRGQQFTNDLSEILTHLCLHQQYHRGQVVTLIRPVADKVPVTDFIAYLREPH